MPNDLDLANANIFINQTLETRWHRDPGLIAMTKDYSARFTNGRHTRDVWNTRDPDLHAITTTDYYADLADPTQPDNKVKDFTLAEIEYDRLQWALPELRGVPGDYMTDDVKNSQMKLRDFYNFKIVDALVGLADDTVGGATSTRLYAADAQLPTVTRAVLQGSPTDAAYRTFSASYLNQFIDAKIRADQMPTLIQSVVTDGPQMGKMPEEGRYAITHVDAEAVIRRALIFNDDIRWFGGAIEYDQLVGKNVPVIQGWKILAVPEMIAFSADGTTRDTSGAGAAAKSYPLIFVTTSNLPVVSALIPMPTIWDRRPQNPWIIRALMGNWWMVESIDDGLVRERMFHSYINVTG